MSNDGLGSRSQSEATYFLPVAILARHMRQPYNANLIERSDSMRFGGWFSRI